MTERVQIDFEDGIAHVQLNRPEKRNGLDLAMFEQLVAAGEALKSRTDVRAVVLSGKGKAFCAGLDWMSFMQAGETGQTQLLSREGHIANVAQRVAYVWSEVPVPVIAALHGVAFGGGLQIALAADMRFIHPETKMSVMEIKWGLIPDMSITQTLPRLVRLDIARELIYTGRIVDAEEAVAIGLATRRCDDPVAEALAAAKAIAQKNPHAIRAGKRLLSESASLNPAEALLFETTLQLPLLGSSNHMEAVQANFMKREPSFNDVD